MSNLWDKLFDRKMKAREQELKYVASFNNEWQFKSYEASLHKNNKKWLGGLAIICSLALGYTSLLKPILEWFA